MSIQNQSFVSFHSIFFFFKGFHIHTLSVSEYNPDCSTAGEHFNPYSSSKYFSNERFFFSLDANHGLPPGNVTTRHVGDLGNIMMNSNNTAIVNITDSIIDLYNATRSIVNRTLVIHATYDNGTSNSSSG